VRGEDHGLAENADERSHLVGRTEGGQQVFDADGVSACLPGVEGDLELVPIHSPVPDSRGEVAEPGW
jgi:hypothetical protein